jgi:hypothetical protein
VQDNIECPHKAWQYLFTHDNKSCVHAKYIVIEIKLML